MSPNKIRQWMQVAQNDGWIIQSQQRIPGAHDRPKFDNYILSKEGFQAWIWVGEKERHSRITITNPQGSRIENYQRLNQENGYCWDSILRLNRLCSRCEEIQDENIVFNPIHGWCPTCYEFIEQLSRNREITPPVDNSLPPAETEGEIATLEFRYVHGQRAVDKVKDYRIIAHTPRRYWEPYNGTSERFAEDKLNKAKKELEDKGFVVKITRVHTTWCGTEIE